MKADWNRRARSHAQFWVATGHHESDATFAQSGESDAQALLSMLAPYHRASWRALEIGCGIGRLLKTLAPQFCYLHGVDVSGEMIRRSRQYLAGIGNVETTESSGTDLQQFTSGCFDLIYSYVAFQHMPEEVFGRYVNESNRLLKVDGYLLFQIYLGDSRHLSIYDTFTVRVYERETLYRRLESAGFHLEQRQLLGSDAPGSESWMLLARKTRTIERQVTEEKLPESVDRKYLSPAEMNMYAALVVQMLGMPGSRAVIPVLHELIETLDGMLVDQSADENVRRFRNTLGELQKKLTGA
jgi:SAM-dependent methyltransferase